MNATPELLMRGFSVQFRDRQVLASVDWHVTAGRPHVLVGPTGGGKSTLLRTLGGITFAPTNMFSGEAMLCGAPLSASHHGAFVTQRASTMLGTVGECLRGASADCEQLLELLGLAHILDARSTPIVALPTIDARLLLVAKYIHESPALLAVDEPTAGMGESDVARYCAALRAAAARFPILFVVATRHQATARLLDGEVALLAGGRIVEAAPADEFFSAPKTASAKLYCRTGNCPSPSPGIPSVVLDHGLRSVFPEFFPELVAVGGDSANENDGESPPTAESSLFESSVSAKTVPPPPGTGYWETSDDYITPVSTTALVAPLVPLIRPLWVHEARGASHGRLVRLGGCRRPGLLADLTDDLRALRSAGVDILISLESEHRMETSVVRAFGIAHRHIPFPDMHAPAAYQMVELCTALDGFFDAGLSVCVHCRAGLGRTGTVLAGYLIWKGRTPSEAIREVRAKEPRFISSLIQEDFLSALAYVASEQVAGTG